MKKINSWNEILECVSEFRNKGCFFNNFYPNESEMSVWIENSELFIESIEEFAYFFVRKTEIADFIYFFVKDFTDLKIALQKLQDVLQAEIVVYDYICKSEEERELIKEISSDGGFDLHTSLRRMSFVLKENSFEDEQEIAFAEEKDIDFLLDMFNSAFDPVSERIPAKQQLKAYIEHNNILICKKQEQIAGFAVIEIQKKSMYLKHLLTSPNFRRQGIAEKLLNKAFFLSKGCIRFMLWVIDTNTPAINLYKKFGYDFEILSNYTFVSKKQKIFDRSFIMSEKILTILKSIRPEFEFDGVEDFFDEGLLDSFDLVTLVSELDKAFNIHIDGMDIVAENFLNVAAIENLLKKNGVN